MTASTGEACVGEMARGRDRATALTEALTVDAHRPHTACLPNRSEVPGAYRVVRVRRPWRAYA